jgi:hypothetical protein
VNGRGVERLDCRIVPADQHRDLGAAEDDALGAASSQAKLQLSELFDQLLDDHFIIS